MTTADSVVESFESSERIHGYFENWMIFNLICYKKKMKSNVVLTANKPSLGF